MGLIFFFQDCIIFILKWQLSPLLPLERLPVHLDCHLIWPPGLGGAFRRPVALLRGGWEGGPERHRGRGRTQKAAVGGREASKHPQRRRRSALLATRRRPSAPEVAVHLQRFS